MDIKKYLIIFVLVGFLVMTAVPVMARGLVPCGGYEENGDPEPDCDLNMLFKMIGDIADNIVKIYAPIVAVALFSVGGMFWIMSKGDTGKVDKGKQLMKAAVIGLVVIWAAYFIVQQILNALGSVVKL